jgi:hypothetical protein
MSDIDKRAIDASLMPTAIPWVVVFYHSFFAVWALCGFLGSLFVLVLNPLDATTLLGPPLALLCTLLLGWTAWGIAHRQATAIRWSRRIHLLIASIGLLGVPVTLWMILVLLFGKDYYGRNWGIFATIACSIPATIVGATSWACWRLLSPLPAVDEHNARTTTPGPI